MHAHTHTQITSTYSPSSLKICIHQNEIVKQVIEIHIKTSIYNKQNNYTRGQIQNTFNELQLKGHHYHTKYKCLLLTCKIERKIILLYHIIRRIVSEDNGIDYVEIMLNLYIKKIPLLL